MQTRTARKRNCIPSPLLATSLLIAALIIWAPTNAAAQSATPKNLVELYTSQGCSSCPPANALLKKYISRKDVIALSLPVDYWDYLGWPDEFGKAQFSTRQRHYATARGDGQVYTPQIVANGIDHAVGSRPSAVDKAINHSLQTVSNRQIAISLKLNGDQLTVSPSSNNTGSAHATDANQPATTIWLALVTKKATTAVPRGENRGATITYYNVVRDLKAVGKWQGKPFTMTLPKNHSMAGKPDGLTDSCVVFLQEGANGPVIGAAEQL